MAKGKHISEDEIKYIVDVESAKAQQEIRKLEKSTDNLRSKSFKRFTICTIYSMRLENSCVWLIEVPKTDLISRIFGYVKY